MNKCIMCNGKSNYNYGMCNKCLDVLKEFEEYLEPSKKALFFSILPCEYRVKVYKKCIGKSRRKQLHIIRNFFNWCGFISNSKNSLNKYFRIKI